MIKISIAEDHQSLIDGIDLLLKYEEDYKIIHTANNGKDLLEQIKKKQPDVVLTDIRMPILDGISLTQTITQLFPKIKIIAFTMFDQLEAIEQMRQAGAHGYILKSSGLNDLKIAIDTVLKGENYYDKAIDIKTLGQNISNKKTILSKSEREILQLIGKGLTSNEIAEERYCSVSTVETHRKNMIKKLGLQGKGELLRYAIEKKYDFN
ncbi:response regulator transcription factor [Mesonia sp. HuA40]|uniref:response regulator n=1 Tax=Mesonia sp. HuA40 TaxID=2602761 RepID=UPI0011CA268B|nr:response regulator transcription factor [Mesonia sp. HuA40]TXK73584.1 response regulator transcription factor [Mesonia sp. HuA40]